MQFETLNTLVQQRPWKHEHVLQFMLKRMEAP